MIEHIQVCQSAVRHTFSLVAAWRLHFILGRRSLIWRFLLFSRLRRFFSRSYLFFFISGTIFNCCFLRRCLLQHHLLVQIWRNFLKRLIEVVEVLQRHLIHLIVVHLLIVLIDLLLAPIRLMTVVNFVLLRVLLFPSFSSLVSICTLVPEFALSWVSRIIYLQRRICKRWFCSCWAYLTVRPFRFASSWFLGDSRLFSKGRRNTMLGHSEGKDNYFFDSP